MSDPPIFHDILDQFPVRTLLKQGGQKVAYRIDHPEYGEAVLKIGHYDSVETLERIRREVALLRDITSEYYPRNFDFQLVSNQRFFIIEEYIDSRPLTQCLQEYSNPRAALPLVRHLVVGLDVLWQRSIVHRDVKPDNLLIVADKSPKIIDLGIARLLKETSLTHPLAMWGPATFNYAAPEQLTNQKSIIDPRTDQFNLGIVLMQLLLSGGHPFDPLVVGSGASIPANILAGNWCKVSLDDPTLQPLQPLVRKLLGPQPYQRYRETPILLDAIDACIEVLG